MKAVYINGLLITLTQDTLTYREIKQLAMGVVGNNPTVQYTRGGTIKPSGAVLPGETIGLVDGMVIDVALTGAA